MSSTDSAQRYFLTTQVGHIRSHVGPPKLIYPPTTNNSNRVIRRQLRYLHRAQKPLGARFATRRYICYADDMSRTITQRELRNDSGCRFA